MSQLDTWPMVAIVFGLAAYAVLGGADFGVGFWQLTAGKGEQSRAIRDHAQHAIAAVWEANHVWLIFVLVICWTAYPAAFASITSTLAAAFLIAAIGIILRGTTYVLRGSFANAADHPVVGGVFALSSILTPFALGAAAGGIASGRVPVGNARGDLISSWINPTSILSGALCVVTGAYLAAVYLAADARRANPALVEPFRRRALAASVVAGCVAIAGLVVVRDDARRLFDGLTTGAALVAVAVSVLAGLTTIALVFSRRFGPARVAAALAVAALVAGWPLAQRPYVLPGLTIHQAAAPRATLVALLVAVPAGAAILVPSLALLFRLVLRGTFDPDRSETPPTTVSDAGTRSIRPPVRTGVAALVLGLSGTAMVTLSDNGIVIGAGLAVLAVAIVGAFVQAAARLLQPGAATAGNPPGVT